MHIVDYYLARQLLGGIAVALLALIAIDGVIDFLDEIDRVDADYPLETMLFNSLLEISISAYELLPIAVLLGCVIGLGSLTVHYELLALRTCGYTRGRITGSILAIATVLMVATFVYGEWIVPKAQYWQCQIKRCGELQSHFFAANNGYWLRDGNYFMRFKAYTHDGEYVDIDVFDLDRNYRLQQHISAARASARGREKTLLLENAEIVRFGDANSIQKQRIAQLHIPFSLSELIHTMPPSLKPEQMTLYQLYSYIHLLEHSDLNTAVHELALWTRLSTLLSFVVVILLAIPWLFTVHSAAMGRRFFIAVLLGLTYVIASHILGNLSISHEIPAWLGAFSPVILFAALGIYLLKTIR